MQVQNVTVTAWDLGKAGDNYSLNGNGICWATDYYNEARLPTDLYHPYVTLGAQLDSVSGILEQYTKSPDWDYYQICTTSYRDVVPEPATVGLLLLGGGLLVRRKRKVGA